MYKKYIYWTSIIRDIYNQVNKEKNIESKLKKIAKSMKKKYNYGVTGCQKANDVSHFKFYVNILNEGNILDGKYSRLIFINNPYITKDINYPNLIFFDIEAKSFNSYDEVSDIARNLKIKKFSLDIDLHFTKNEKFKVHQYLPNEDFIFIDNTKEYHNDIQNIINNFQNKLNFIQIKHIDNTNDVNCFENVKILNNVLTFREMLYFIGFSKYCILSDTDHQTLLNSNKMIINSDFSDQKCRIELDNIVNNSNKFYDLKEIMIDDFSEVEKNITRGKQSIIKTFKISDETKNKIEDKLNYKIDNIIVKKTYIDVENDPNPNRDNSLILNMGGKFEQMKREVNSLKKIYKKDNFPLLLGIDYKNFCIYMNYCGTSLTKENIPTNWKRQISKISETLNQLKVYNNDVWINNFLVNEDKLYLIDFGYSSFNVPFYPLLNLLYLLLIRCNFLNI